MCGPLTLTVLRSIHRDITVVLRLAQSRSEMRRRYTL